MEAKVNFYQIQRCGYFRYGSQEPEFGGVGDLLADLSQWVSDKRLGETCTYDLEEDADLHRTYCFDVANRGDDYLLTTWNESPTYDGQVASVSPGARVGEVEIRLSEVPDDSIPGYATYFWFIPARSVLATVRFEQRLNGHRNLVTYLRNYLAKFSRYAVSRDGAPDADLDIIGYRANARAEPEDLRPRFDSVRFRKSGPIDLIRNNHQQIRKIVRKNLLMPFANREDLGVMRRLLRRVGLQEAEPQHENLRVKYEVEHTPSLEELDQIIESWEVEHEAEMQTKWDDIGFKLTKDSEIHWLSHSIVKDTVEIDIPGDGSEVINAEALLNALMPVRHNLLRKLR